MPGPHSVDIAGFHVGKEPISYFQVSDNTSKCDSICSLEHCCVIGTEKLAKMLVEID